MGKYQSCKRSGTEYNLPYTQSASVAVVRVLYFWPFWIFLALFLYLRLILFYSIFLQNLNWIFF